MKDLASGIESKTPTIELSSIDPYKLGTVNRKIITTKGSTITMQCSASTDKFPDDIKWFNGTNLLETDGKFTLDSQTPIDQQPNQQIVNFRKSYDK